LPPGLETISPHVARWVEVARAEEPHSGWTALWAARSTRPRDCGQDVHAEYVGSVVRLASSLVAQSTERLDVLARAGCAQCSGGG
jgi:hypothetical protein